MMQKQKKLLKKSLLSAKKKAREQNEIPIYIFWIFTKTSKGFGYMWFFYSSG